MLYTFPFSQLVDNCISDNKETSSDSVIREKYRAKINSELNNINEAEYDFLYKESQLSFKGSLSSGTVDISSGGLTTVTGSSASLFANYSDYTDYHLGLKIKFNGNDEIYPCIYTTDQTLTLKYSYSDSVGLSGGGYTLFVDSYVLPSDFQNSSNNMIYYRKDGNVVKLKQENYSDILNQLNWIPSYDVTNYAIYPSRIESSLLDYTNNKNNIGLLRLVLPIPFLENKYATLYYKKLLPFMTEISLSASISGSTVTVSSSSSSNIGKYIKSDTDKDSSCWRKIIACPSGTTYTLDSSYSRTVSTETCKISDVIDLELMPITLIRYKTNIEIATSNNDGAVKMWIELHKKTESALRKQAKNVFGSNFKYYGQGIGR